VILLPFEKYALSTTLSVQASRQRLLDNLEPARGFAYIMRNKTRPYTGRIGSEDFEISRAIRYRNSFLPIIKGRFSDQHDHTEIQVTMRLNPLVVAFMSVWTAGVSIACGATIRDLLTRSPERPFAPVEMLSFGMLFAGYGFCLFLFKFESSNAKRFLSRLWL
jgi:hypothetical protein